MTEHSGWAPQRVASSISCNLVPGVILRGASIAPKPGQSYKAMFLEWDWAGWLKPQVDALHSIGGNTVRLIGDVAGVNDGTFTQATYDANWSQLITYAATLGMYVYPAGGGVSQFGTLTPAQVGATVATAATNWARYANVVGIDVVQEAVRSQAQGSYALSFPDVLTGPVRAVTSLPLTLSYAADESFGAPRWTFPLWRRTLRPYVDFWDIHVYHQAPPAMLYSAFWGQGETKPILIGEFGMSQGRTSADRAARIQNMVALASERELGLHPAGVLQWAIYPQDTVASNDYGMFNSDGSARTELTALFAQLPTA